MSSHDCTIEVIAFDLDGTLIDSAPDIAAALNRALRESALPGVELEQVRGWIGDGPDVMIERALRELKLAADAQLRTSLREAFDRFTLQAPMVHGAVFDGIADLLAQLAQRWRIAVITNKPSALARSVLRDAGLLQHIRLVRGADVPAQRKPAPAMLLTVAEQLGVAPRQVVMVGDGPTDLLCAQAAGAGAVLVGWGYAVAAARQHPHRIEITRPAQLLRWLHEAA